MAAKPWSWLLMFALALHAASALWRFAGLGLDLSAADVPFFVLVPVLWGFWQLSISSPLRARLRISPEWGYVSFLIPLVNLVVPYLAVRELFFVRVPGARRRQLWLVAWWLAFVASQLSELTWLLVDDPFTLPPMLLESVRALAALCALRVVHLISIGGDRSP